MLPTTKHENVAEKVPEMEHGDACDIWVFQMLLNQNKSELSSMTLHDDM